MYTQLVCVEYVLCLHELLERVPHHISPRGRHHRYVDRDGVLSGFHTVPHAGREV